MLDLFVSFTISYTGTVCVSVCLKGERNTYSSYEVMLLNQKLLLEINHQH